MYINALYSAVFILTNAVAEPLPETVLPLQSNSRAVYQYSTKCSTPTQICYVPAQPIGSICYCGSTQGTIVP